MFTSKSCITYACVDMILVFRDKAIQLLFKYVNVLVVQMSHDPYQLNNIDAFFNPTQIYNWFRMVSKM